MLTNGRLTVHILHRLFTRKQRNSNKLLFYKNIVEQIMLQQQTVNYSADKPPPGELDPIQKLFIDSLKEYAKKIKENQGKLFDPIPEIEKERVELMKTLKKKYFKDEGIDEGKTTEFPSFTYKEKPLDSIEHDTSDADKKE